MSGEKYIGLDVHQATISVAVMDSQGQVHYGIHSGNQSIHYSRILEFLAGLRGSLFVTFEEGTWAAWLYDLLKPHVTEVLVCNPRKNALRDWGRIIIAAKIDPQCVLLDQEGGRGLPKKLAPSSQVVAAVAHCRIPAMAELVFAGPAAGFHFVPVFVPGQVAVGPSLPGREAGWKVARQSSH